jgi:hypothetical protein
LVGKLILSKKSAAKNLWRQAFFLMHWPSLLYGYWFSNDYFLLAYAFGKRVRMGPKYFSGSIWIFKFCETLISILSKRSESTRIVVWSSGSALWVCDFKKALALFCMRGTFYYASSVSVCDQGKGIYQRWALASSPIPYQM